MASLKLFVRELEIQLFLNEESEREENPEKQKAHLTFVVVGDGPTGVELKRFSNHPSRVIPSSREDFVDANLVFEELFRQGIAEVGNANLEAIYAGRSIPMKYFLSLLRMLVSRV